MTESDPHRAEPPTPEEPVVLKAEQLFQGRREILIEHEGIRYRLRITKKGRLVLHK